MKGKEYIGTMSVTKYGATCKRWDSYGYSASAFPDATLSDAQNYCRNPDYSYTLWCFIDYSYHYQYCYVPFCQGNLFSVHFYIYVLICFWVIEETYFSVCHSCNPVAFSYHEMSWCLCRFHSMQEYCRWA